MPEPTSALAISMTVRNRARAILESPQYEASLRLRVLSGTLPPGIEMMLWHYAYGKPADYVQVEVPKQVRDEVAKSTDMTLEERLAATVKALHDAREREAREAAEAADRFAKEVEAAAQNAANYEYPHIPEAKTVEIGERADGAALRKKYAKTTSDA